MSNVSVDGLDRFRFMCVDALEALHLRDQAVSVEVEDSGGVVVKKEEVVDAPVKNEGDGDASDDQEEQTANVKWQDRGDSFTQEEEIADDPAGRVKIKTEPTD